jgi:hypothetical protein
MATALDTHSVGVIGICPKELEGKGLYLYSTINLIMMLTTLLE